MTSSPRRSHPTTFPLLAAQRTASPRAAIGCPRVDTRRGDVNATIASPSTARLWNTKELARFLGCSVRQIPRLREQGLPVVRIGFLVRFDPAAVRAWIEARQTADA